MIITMSVIIKRNHVELEFHDFIPLLCSLATPIYYLIVFITSYLVQVRVSE